VLRLGLDTLATISSLRDGLLDRFPENFGGLYNRGDSRTFVVLTVGDDAGLREFTSAHLADFTSDDPAIAARLPRVVFQPATRPLRLLIDLQDRIFAERDELSRRGIVFHAVGVRDDVNRVLAFVAAPNQEDARQLLLDRYGDGVEIQIGTFIFRRNPQMY